MSRLQACSTIPQFTAFWPKLQRKKSHIYTELLGLCVLKQLEAEVHLSLIQIVFLFFCCANVSLVSYWAHGIFFHCSTLSGHWEELVHHNIAIVVSSSSNTFMVMTMNVIWRLDHSLVSTAVIKKYGRHLGPLVYLRHNEVSAGVGSEFWDSISHSSQNLSLIVFNANFSHW